MNSYKSLSNEYLYQSKLIKNHIGALKQSLKNPMSEQERKLLEYRISTMYSMYLELNHVGDYLSTIVGRDKK